MAMMETLSFVLGILGNVISILLFASPLPTFWRIFKSKSTEDFRILPYVCTLLNTSLWTYYGLIKPKGTFIMTINAAGSAFEAFYILLFLIFCPNHNHNKIKNGFLAFSLNIVIYGIIVILTMLLISNPSRRVFVVGFISAIVSVSVYASPLGVMRMVIRTKSVEYMPFLLSLFLFLNASVWAAYALVIKDIFVGIPNGIGVVLGVAQLLLYYMYMKDKNLNEDGTKKGDAKMVEISTLQSHHDHKTTTNNHGYAED